MLRSVRILLIAFLLLGGLGAEVCAQYVASREGEWPQFRGPERNGISSEKGLLQQWPEGGPPEVWCATNIGSGYASPIVADGRIYISGDVGDELHIFALSLAGRTLWKSTNGPAWKTPYPGARASCAFLGGKLYHMNGHGQVACFDASNGKIQWQVDAISRFESRKPTWGVSECLLAYDGKVIVTPGGSKASMAALDAATGRTLWKTEPFDTNLQKPEGPAYAPPILIRVLGQQHIVGVGARHFFGVNAATGELQWRFEFPTRYQVLGSSAVFCNGGVFVTGPDGGSGKFLCFEKEDWKISVRQAWTASMDTCHGGMIYLDGFLYGAWYRSHNGWGCVDAQDGSVRWQSKELAMGASVYADGRLYCLTQTGIMALVRPNPDKLEIVSRFVFAAEHQNNVWAHPVIAGGRLYLRDQQELHCFNIRENGTYPKN